MINVPCGSGSAYPAVRTMQTLLCVPCSFFQHTLRHVPCGFWSAYPAVFSAYPATRTLQFFSAYPATRTLRFLVSVPCSFFQRTLQLLACSGVSTNFETHLIDLPPLLNLPLYYKQPSPTSHPRRQMSISRVRVRHPATISHSTLPFRSGLGLGGVPCYFTYPAAQP